jgi:hypothetical protein
MCVLPLPQGCGRGGPTGFAAVANYLTMSHNDVRRCPAASMPSQHPLNCLNFRIQHGYEPNTHDCATCTNIIMRFPPDQIRQPPVQASFEAGRYYDGPLPTRPDTAQRATNNNNPFVPGLSRWAPTYAEAAAPAPPVQQDDLVHPIDNQPYHAPGPVDMANLGGVIRPRQNHRLNRQQTQANLFTPPTPPVRLRSTSRNRIRTDDPTAPIATQLLEESLEANSVLIRENEQLKSENANLLRWMTQHGPRFQH